MKTFIIILSFLLLLHCTMAHISLQQLDFLNIGKHLRRGRNLLVGDPKYTQTRSMAFDPYQSDRLTTAFQQTYGFRGENLIHAIGAGYPMSELRRFNAAS